MKINSNLPNAEGITMRLCALLGASTNRATCEIDELIDTKRRRNIFKQVVF
jgi:hypothetical protein